VLKNRVAVPVLVSPDKLCMRSFAITTLLIVKKIEKERNIFRRSDSRQPPKI
jgi:hypothetical protein